MELCRRRPGSRQEGTVEETTVDTPLTVTGTIADIHTKTGQTMNGKAGWKNIPAEHLTEKNATLTEEKEIMQTAEKDPEAKETAKAVPLNEEALPEPPAATEPPAEVMLRMTEEAADTARAAPENEGMQEREADPEDHEGYEEYDRFDEPKNRDDYEDLEKLQQKRRRMDIENMADFDEQEEYGNYRDDPDLMNDEDLDELDEWKDN